MLTKVLLGALAIAVIAAAILAALWKGEEAAHAETRRAAADEAARANLHWSQTLERRLADQASSQARVHASELIRAQRRATIAERIANAPSAPLAACPAIGTALGVLRERSASDRGSDAAAAGRAADVRPRPGRSGTGG